MIGELAKCFQIPDETIRLDLHYIENSSSKSGYFTYCLKSISDSLFLIAFSALQQTHIWLSACQWQKWVLYDIPKHPQHWLSAKYLVPRSSRLPLYTLKILFCVWLINRQMVHYKLQPMGQTITAHLYSKMLKCVQLALVNLKGMLLFHSSARPHVMQVIRNTIQQLCWETLSSTILPDLAPTDKHLFPSSDINLHGNPSQIK